MQTSYKPPKFVDSIIGIFNAHGYECVLSGGWLRDYVLLKSNGSPEGMIMNFTLREIDPNQARGVEFRVHSSDAALQTAKYYMDKIPDWRCSNLDIETYCDETGETFPYIRVELTKEDDEDEFVVLSFHVLEIMAPIRYVSKFCLGLSQILYDGARYRITDTFRENYENKILTVERFTDNDIDLREYAKRIQHYKYPEYELKVITP